MKKTSLLFGLLLILSPSMQATETPASNAVQSYTADYPSDSCYKVLVKVIEYIMHSGTSEDIRNFRLACRTFAQESAKLISDKDKENISKFFRKIKRYCTTLALSKFEEIRKKPTAQEIEETTEDEIKKNILSLFFSGEPSFFKEITNNIREKICLGKLIGYFKGQEHDLLFTLLARAAINDQTEVLYNLLRYVVSTLSSDNKKELLEYVAQAKGKKLASVRFPSDQRITFILDITRHQGIFEQYNSLENLIKKLPVREQEEFTFSNNNVV